MTIQCNNINAPEANWKMYVVFQFINVFSVFFAVDDRTNRTFYMIMWDTLYWKSRPSQHLEDPHDWRPSHNTQMYAILPSYDFTWSFKHATRCVKLRQPLRTRNHLREISDRAEWNLLKTLVKEATSGTVVRALMTDYSKLIYVWI
jgi:hypothetical protein